MSSHLKHLLVIITLAAMPLVVGCLGSGNFNPVADTSLSQGASGVALNTAAVAPVEARFKATNSKKYTFADPPHKVCHRAKAGIAKAAGCLRLLLKCQTADHIYITVSHVKVKPAKGQSINVSVPSTEIDLKDASALSSVLAEVALPQGLYNYFSFKVTGGRAIIKGVEYSLFIPRGKVNFLGKFEIKDGYDTALTIKYMFRLLKVGHHRMMMIPIVKIASELVAKPLPPEVTNGDVTCNVSDFVKKTALAGVAATLEGTTFSATSDSQGAFSFATVPAGTYNLKLTHPEYLDKSFSVEVVAGEVAEVAAEMNPAVIRSTVSNTGWFSQRYPLADANGAYGEVALEAPVTIDFVSLTFVKAELVFDADYHATGAGRLQAYLSSSQQVTVITNLGGWWVGNNALLGSYLGEFYATTPTPSHYAVDVTEYVRNNPSSSFFVAAKNMVTVDIRLQNIQLNIYYR